MVKNLHVTLDDTDFEKVKEVKDDLGMTWEEFVLEATDRLAEEVKTEG
jgi:hypothetical protein